MAFLIPTTIIGYWIGDKIADGIGVSITAIHESYLSIEKSIQNYIDQSRQEEIARQQCEYREKVETIRNKWNLN